MRPRTIRRLVVAVCLLGVAGMIVSSIASSTGAAITFGLVTAVAVLALIVLTAAVGSEAFHSAASPAITDEAAAEQLEHEIHELVVEGASEARLRDLVRDAIRLGRSAERSSRVH